MICIINYGMGNISSLSKALTKIGANHIVSSKHEDIKKSSHLILPGVGHFEKAMQNIHDRDLFNIIRDETLNHNKPILGICLGMQLIFNESEEGNNPKGLGLINGSVKHFSLDTLKFRIPHIGWNEVFGPDYNNCKLFQDIKENSNFYFVHSFHAVLEDQDQTTVKLITDYGYNFVSVVQQNNIFGTQFHPEKSQVVGLKILKNFVNIRSDKNA